MTDNLQLCHWKYNHVDVNNLIMLDIYTLIAFITKFQVITAAREFSYSYL